MEPMPLELVLSVLGDTPDTDKVHHPYTAFNQGYDARKEHGLPVDVNPYTDERLAAWWKCGWETAEDQETCEA